MSRTDLVPLFRRINDFWLLVIGLFTLILPQIASAGDLDRHYEIDAEQLTVTNLIGEITVQSASGPDFEVDIRIEGDDADGDLIDVDIKKARKSNLTIKFPAKKRKYHYPGLHGRNAKVNITDPGKRKRNNGSFWSAISPGKKIQVSNRRSGLEVWVDVTIKVPAGKTLNLYHGAGDIFAENIEGELILDSQHGLIMAADIKGDLLADTGSGQVVVENITGSVSIDTGSGSVEAQGCQGEEFRADTGSGSVKVRDIECEYMLIDTGSGGVRAIAIKCNAATIDTGSGSVKLELDQMGSGNYKVDTGSGGIEFIMPENPSAYISADTGSGSIHVDVDGVQLRLRSRDHINFKIGDGDADVELDAGSGSIRII